MPKKKLVAKSTGKPCPHTDQIRKTTSKIAKCQECGETWELRMCMSCGHVGCCESSKAHDAEHSKKTKHPIIKRLPEGFIWCYACKDYLS